MTKYSITAVLALCLASGCMKRVEGGSAEEKRSAKTYFPLEVGNRWTYQTQFLGQQLEEKVEILQRAGGFFVDNQGNRLTVDAYGVRDEKRYLLQEPLEVGHSWKTIVSVQSAEYYQVLQAGVACQSAAGAFSDCVVVEARNRVREGSTLINEMTFAPRVGLVSMNVVLEEQGKRIPQTRRELTAYEIK